MRFELFLMDTPSLEASWTISLTCFPHLAFASLLLYLATFFSKSSSILSVHPMKGLKFPSVDDLSVLVNS